MNDQNMPLALFVSQMLQAADEQGRLDAKTGHPVVLVTALVFDAETLEASKGAADAALERIKEVCPAEGAEKFTFASLAVGQEVPVGEEEDTLSDAVVERIAPTVDRALGSIVHDLPTLEELFADLRKEARAENKSE